MRDNSNAKKLVGPEASVRKYDLLTALAVAGLAGGPHLMATMTRLIALITARYNWRADEVVIGQADLARLWSVDIRTVKRELRRLRDLGLLLVKRPGVRGRVACYALNHGRIDALTAAHWDHVGPDFQARMAMRGAETGTALPAGHRTEPLDHTTTVIPFPTVEGSTTEWGRARQHLNMADPARYRAWFQPLRRQSRDGPLLILEAPSAFHAGYVQTHLLGELVRAVMAVDPDVRAVQITD